MDKSFLCRILTLLAFILTVASQRANAQPKSIYFNGNKVTSNANLATSYGVYGKLSGQDLWVLKRYDLHDNLMFSGTYKDEQLATPHGKFIFYGSIYVYNTTNATSFKNATTDRYVLMEGEYIDGLEEGKWYEYFPNGSIQGHRTYKGGKLDGDFRVYNLKGHTTLMGNHANGLKTGIWYDFKKKKRQLFQNDKLISTDKLTKSDILAVE